ncbi:MAG: hypothetical protein AAF985_05995 [Bacteroidota bacterium]
MMFHTNPLMTMANWPKTLPLTIGRSLLLLLLCGICLNSARGQKVLQMEKYGKAKTKKYFIGDVLTYQLEGDDLWYTEVIQDILVEEESLLFPSRLIPIDQIRKIKSFKNRRWSRALGTSLFLFSGGFMGLSLIAAATTSFTLGTNFWLFPAIAVPLGFLVRWIFKSKTYKLGKKRKLRVLDLNVIPHQNP